MHEIQNEFNGYSKLKTHHIPSYNVDTSKTTTTATTTYTIITTHC